MTARAGRQMGVYVPSNLSFSVGVLQDGVVLWRSRPSGASWAKGGCQRLRQNVLKYPVNLDFVLHACLLQVLHCLEPTCPGNKSMAKVRAGLAITSPTFRRSCSTLRISLRRSQIRTSFSSATTVQNQNAAFSNGIPRHSQPMKSNSTLQSST